MASPECYNVYKQAFLSDTVDLPMGPCDALYLSAGGNVAAVMQDNTVTVFIGLAAGTLLPIKARRVNTTGTTASIVIALYDR